MKRNKESKSCKEGRREMNVMWMIESGGGRKDRLPGGGAEGGRKGGAGHEKSGMTGDVERLSGRELLPGGGGEKEEK